MVDSTITRTHPPLRIAMLSLHSSPLGPLGTRDTGGMSVYVCEVARQMANAGHWVDIFTFVPGPDPIARLGPRVRLIELDHGQEKVMAKERLIDHRDRMALALERFSRSDASAYDVVHSHYWISGSVGARVTGHWGCPHVITFHTLGLIKNLTTEGESEPEVRIANERRLVDSVDAVVVPSDGERRHLLDLYGADAGKVHTIPCGVNLEQFEPMDQLSARERLDLDPGVAVLLFVGRFAPVKGMEALLRAVADISPRWKPLKLVVVGGDGPEAPVTWVLERRIEALGIAPHVRLAGRVEHRHLPLYYNAADLLVLPSTYESFGLVILEALACGTPVAATRVGGAVAAIQEGVNGTLIDHPNGRSVAKGIERVLNRVRNNQLPATQIRKTVMAYGWQRIAGSILSLYDTLLPGAVSD